MNKKLDLRPAGCFLVLLVLFSTPVWALSIHVGQSPAMLSRIIMWCPAIAALFTCLICRISFATLGWQLPSARFGLIGYFLPWIYALPVYAITWLTVAGSFAGVDYSAHQAEIYRISEHSVLFSIFFSIPANLTFAVLSTVVWALGEELGWRGFLTPQLSKCLGPTGAGLVVGAIWAAWHYPLLLGADYNAGTQPAYALGCFTVMVIAMGVVLSWLRLKSKSVWPCVLLHASHNCLVQGTLDPMTSGHGVSPYITTEFGAGMAFTLSIVAVTIVARKRRKNEKQILNTLDRSKSLAGQL